MWRLNSLVSLPERGSCVMVWCYDSCVKRMIDPLCSQEDWRHHSTKWLGMHAKVHMWLWWLKGSSDKIKKNKNLLYYIGKITHLGMSHIKVRFQLELPAVILGFVSSCIFVTLLTLAAELRFQSLEGCRGCGGDRLWISESLAGQNQSWAHLGVWLRSSGEVYIHEKCEGLYNQDSLLSAPLFFFEL